MKGITVFKIKKSKNYYFSIVRKGRRIQKSTGTHIKKLAQEIAEKVHTQVINGIWFVHEKAQSIKFSKVWESYYSNYKRQRDPITIKPLMKFFGDKSLAEITALDVVQYINDRKELSKNLSHATIYQEYRLGSKLLKYAKKILKATIENPFSDVDIKDLLNKPNPRKRVISVIEELALLSNAYSRDIRDFIIAAIHSGCRRGEILSWDWHNTVIISKRFLKVRVSKRKRDEEVYKLIPMSETLYKMLIRRAKVKHISGKVFPMDIQDVRYAFEKTAEKAGIQNIRVHDFRRTFSTRLDEFGVPLNIIKALLGHSISDITELHYINRLIETLRPHVLLLDEYYNKYEISEEDKMKLAG